jgi:hypothetical protein
MLQNNRHNLLERAERIQQQGIEVMGGIILRFDTDRETLPSVCVRVRQIALGQDQETEMGSRSRA